MGLRAKVSRNYPWLSFLAPDNLPVGDCPGWVTSRGYRDASVTEADLAKTLLIYFAVPSLLPSLSWVMPLTSLTRQC